MSAVTEAELASKAVAPRVTPADIEANIASEHYFTAKQGAIAGDFGNTDKPAALGLLTFCVLVLRNGFTVVGKSAPASAENFDPDVGRRIAREDAIRQCWPLMGYALKDRLTLAVREG